MKKLALVAVLAVMIVGIAFTSVWGAPRANLPAGLVLGLDYTAMTWAGTSWPAWAVEGSYELDRSWGIVGSYLQAESAGGYERHLTHFGLQRQLTPEAALQIGIAHEQRLTPSGNVYLSDGGLAIGVVLSTPLGKEARGYATFGVLALGDRSYPEYALGVAFPLSPRAEVDFGYRAVDDMGGVGVGLAVQF